MLNDQNQSMYKIETQELADSEVERLRAYKRIYAETHPMPVKRDVDFKKTMGLEATATLLSSIGGVVLAAVRTATIFYVSELSLLTTYNISLGFLFQTLLVILPLLAMISALFAVEGFLFARGLADGKMQKEARGSRWGMFFALGISVIAGIVASLPLVKSLVATSIISIGFQWLLVIMTGVGATVLAYYGAKNLGAIDIRRELLQAELDSEYEIKITAWEEKALRAYLKQGREGIFGMDALPTDKKVKGVKAHREELDITQRVRDWLSDNNINASDIGIGPGMQMKPSELAHKMGLEESSGAVRTALSRIRNSEKHIVF